MLDSAESSAGLLEESLGRDITPMTPAERRAERLVGLAFIVAAAATVVFAGGAGEWHPAPAVCAVLAMALAMNARFDVGAGFTPPTQLAFVPLVFSAPVGWVPGAVALALALGRVPDVLTGQIRPGRLLLALGNAWFALGPVLVLACAGEDAVTTPWIVALALGAQFVVDFAAGSVRERLLGLRIPIGETLRMAGPVYAVDAVLAPIGVLAALAADEHWWAVLPIVPLLGLLAIFARERRARLEQLLELHHAYRGTALVLGDVVEADDGYTGEHSKSVVELCLAVGARLGLGADRLRNLEFAALLHDVGKIAIPKAIINKPGALDDEEWAIIKTHTVEGQRMLDRVGGFMREVGTIVRSHHERWDGGGYPDGLAGDEIPLEARIISVCDTWNAMRTNRSYRSALPFAEAEAEVLRHAGTQFDPTCARALLDVVEHERTGAAAATVRVAA